MKRINRKLCKRYKTLEKLRFVNDNNRKGRQEFGSHVDQSIRCVTWNRIAVVCCQFIKILKPGIDCGLYNQNPQVLRSIFPHKTKRIGCLARKHGSKHDFQRHCELNTNNMKTRMDTDAILASCVATSVAVIATLCVMYTIYKHRQRRPMSESDVSDLHDDGIV